MLIYRVEHAVNNLGPYVGASPRVNEAIENHARNHPPPYEDGENLRCFWHNCLERKRFQFAFISLEQLNNWFNVEERQVLHEEGFVIKVIEASNVVSGDMQVIYDARTSKVLDTQQLNIYDDRTDRTDSRDRENQYETKRQQNELRGFSYISEEALLSPETTCSVTSGQRISWSSE